MLGFFHTMIDGNNIEAHPLLSEAFTTETDQVSSTTSHDGNAATFLPSGGQSYVKRWELIDGARHSIDLATFSVMNDETSYRLRDMLTEKMRQGVRVRMVVDDLAVYSASSAAVLADIAKAGASLIRYHKVFRDLLPDVRKGHPLRQLVHNFRYKLKRRFHEKFTLVDGRALILGGINWGNKYAFGGLKPEAWRDTDIYLTGPAVADVQRQFIRSFFLYEAMEREYFERRKPGFDREVFHETARQNAERAIAEDSGYFPALVPAGTERVRYVPHKPYDEESLRMTDVYLMMFRNAKKYIYWGCHAIRPPRIIAETLAEAVQRGIEVRLITNGPKPSRTLMAHGFFGFLYWECANHFRWLIEHGIRVFEWQKPGAFHSKNLAIDDVVAAVGSYNVAPGSTFHHTESAVIIYGGDLPATVKNQFEIDFQDCREVQHSETQAPIAFFDPFRQPLAPRNRLINRALLTDAVRQDLDAGRVKSS
jgi:phosphatidylserine/phosphatidylglycerophosphate/cardiolipin synthase-like enzyme